MLAKTCTGQSGVAMAFLLLATASCQGNQASPNHGDGASPQAPAVAIELAAFCAQAVPAYCDNLARCRPNQAMEPYADCLVHQGPTWCAELLSPKFLASIAAGRTRWSSTQASQCVQDLAAPACRTTKASTACSSLALFTGTVAAGGACTWIQLAPSECRRGYCQTTTPCSGTCTSLLADGATCTDESDCAGGLYCIDPATGRDRSGSTACTCTPRQRQGDACASAGPACDNGFGCVAGFCTVLRLGSGQPCKYNEECEGDLVCRPSGAGSACGPRSKSGDPCTNTEECEAGLTCRKDGRCGPYVHSPDDCASVNAGYGGGDCALGFICSLGSCEPRPTAGGSCGLLAQECFGKNLYCRSNGTRTEPQTICAGLR